jgi:5-hydroxyisourate hydrolase
VTGISTHVLDLGRGRPAEGIPVRLERLPSAAGSGSAATESAVVASAHTDQDGRARLAEAPAIQPGTYRLVFDTSAYHQAQPSGEPPFFPEVAVTFTVHDTDRGYHVPLLLSAYGYSTYRGS